MRTRDQERRYVDGPTLFAEKARLRLYWEPLELASGCTRRVLYKYVTGEWRADLAVIEKLERALQLKPGALIADEHVARQRAIKVQLEKLELRRQLLEQEKSKAA